MIYFLYDKTGLTFSTENIARWSKFMEEHRTVARTVFPSGEEVSTVFLGVNMQMSVTPESDPLAFETMVFGGPFDEYTQRCRTYADALDQHRQVAGAVLAGGLPWQA